MSVKHTLQHESCPCREAVNIETDPLTVCGHRFKTPAGTYTSAQLCKLVNVESRPIGIKFTVRKGPAGGKVHVNVGEHARRLMNS